MGLVVTSTAHAAESTHWYTKEGIPAYEVQAKDGSMRPTTLRDAKKYGYVPSVTTIIRSAASPGLENWKLEQMLMAALTLPVKPDESEKEYLDRVRKDSKEHAKMAAERGTAIHASVEGFYLGQGTGQHPEHVKGVHETLRELWGDQDWIAEKSFSSSMGFGGKCDLCSPAAVVDVKTKEFGVDNLPAAYDEHVMQLAAYRVGLQVPTAACANLFVSVTNPGLVHAVVWSEEELQRGWKMFLGLLDYWYAKSKLAR